MPYIIVINTSRFTTAEFKGQAGAPGVTVLPSFNPLQAFTFAGIMDDMKDNGVLGWMNIQLPGFDGVFALSRPLFLGCECSSDGVLHAWECSGLGGPQGGAA